MVVKQQVFPKISFFLIIIFHYIQALAQLTDRLTERGYKVFVVPETPTMTMEGGGMIIMANLSPEKITKFQVICYFMKLTKIH